LAESGEPESHAASGTVCFPDSPRTPPGSLSRLAEGGRSRTNTHPLGCHSLSRRGCAPAHLTFQCWQRLSESNAHDPLRVIVGFKPSKHATCEPLNWRRADHSKGMLRWQHPSVSNRVQAPACFTLHIWSPPEDLHLTAPAYKAGTPLPVRDGQDWWVAQESHLDHTA